MSATHGAGKRIFLVLAVLGASAMPLRAQQPRPDSSAVPLIVNTPVRVPVRAAADSIPDSLKKPPISPRRAMLMSLLLPGSAQSRLNRPAASMLFAGAEVWCVGMARHAAQDLNEARITPKDSVVASYTVDPSTGIATPSSYVQSRFTPGRIRARHLHYEDWLAAIIFNHIISGVDAYVAANLWDFNANISVTPGMKTASVSANVAF